MFAYLIYDIPPGAWYVNILTPTRLGREYGIPEARQAFNNAPKARGVIFPKYEPVASHGDPKSARNPENLHFVNLSGHIKSDFLDIVCIENRDVCVANTKT